MTKFAMDPRFYARLASIYVDPARTALALQRRTASERKRKGCEVPKLCDEHMQVID